MIARKQLQQVAPYVYEIPQSTRPDMRVPARIYADEALLGMALADQSIEQLVNTTTLPGVVAPALAMPDVHQGYGFPIGGVAATALPDGLISPGGVGYDINCGVRLLTSNLQAHDMAPHMSRLMERLFAAVPTGVGSAASRPLSDRDLTAVCQRGAEWVVVQGLGSPSDLSHTEDGGRLPAEASALSKRARERGLAQLGTLGAGNHFLEVDQVVEIFDPLAAQTLGLRQGQVCVWIHCGSRGLGHQVCTDAVQEMQRSLATRQLNLPDRELAGAPFSSEDGQRYWQAMNCAANYAWANRQAITHLVREAMQSALGHLLGAVELEVLYDVCHNIAKVETHRVAGREMRLCVHRKGATRAFGPGRAETPADYRQVGQPVLIPGSMEAGSYILVGTEKAMTDTFGSCCHGAGRTLSRTAARKGVSGEQLLRQLAAANITVRAGSTRGLAEEAPEAYKDLERVVNVVHSAGIARQVARTRPMGVIKG